MYSLVLAAVLVVCVNSQAAAHNFSITSLWRERSTEVDMLVKWETSDLLKSQVLTYTDQSDSKTEDIDYTHRYRFIEGLNTDTTYEVCLKAISIQDHEDQRCESLSTAGTILTSSLVALIIIILVFVGLVVIGVVVWLVAKRRFQRRWGPAHEAGPDAEPLKQVSSIEDDA